MKRLVLSMVVVAIAAPSSLVLAQSFQLQGFGAQPASRQQELEARFDALLEADNLRQWMATMSARPHHVGSPHGRRNAEMIAELFRSWGYDTEIEVYYVLFPTPKQRLVELVAPRRFVASLEEIELDEDSTSGQHDEQLPSYNAYSADGDVTAELVYVNYGVPDDYDELALRGIDVEGKIVLARYGGSWRGIKPKVAAEHGAIGCILFSDPRDDGYSVGDVYPQGGYRPEQGVQRGSVVDMPLFPGDPLTPGVGATLDAERLSLDEAPTLTSIPVLPISYRDATPLLESLGGPVAPSSWRGSLPLTYHLGPGPATVHLKLEFAWEQVPAYNVIAKMTGAELPDQWIIRGNHHDAWVNGASDPVSGMVVVLEEARALSVLHREGWQPRRTIVFAAWDAEEPGLLGSTEWVEDHAEELSRKAVVYINSDSNQRGFLGMGGSHSLQRLINEVARDVMDPLLGISVADRVRAARAVGGDAEALRIALAGTEITLSPLGSGSDYTPFLQHLGIASLNIGFRGEGDYGQYHSIYDSFDHYTRFMDPDFVYGIALAKVAGRVVMRLANADVLPFDFDALTEQLVSYVDEVEELADSMRTDTEARNALIDNGLFEAAADPRQTFVVPAKQGSVPHLNFAPLRNALAVVEDSTRRFVEASAGATDLSADQRERLDEVLFRTERALTRSEGLPVRPWFVHYVYAPGFYTGYGVKTLPAVREAIEQREWLRAETQIGLTGEVLRAFATELDRAISILATAN